MIKANTSPDQELFVLICLNQTQLLWIFLSSQEVGWESRLRPCSHTLCVFFSSNKECHKMLYCVPLSVTNEMESRGTKVFGVKMLLTGLGIGNNRTIIGGKDPCIPHQMPNKHKPQF